MPNVAGAASTRFQIFVYAVIVAVVGVLPWAFGYVSAGYGLVAAALGAGFVFYSWKVLQQGGQSGHKAEKALFAFSLLYLFGIFAAYMADAIVVRVVLTGA